MPTPHILRIVLLVAAGLSYIVSLTPPNSATSVDQRRPDKHTAISVLQRGSVTGPILAKTFVTSIAFVEIAVTYAMTWPDVGWGSRYIIAATGSYKLGPTDMSVSFTFFVGVVLACAGAAIRLACYRSLGRHFTFKLALLSKHELVTSGPYAVVRHPSYTGLAMLSVGLTACELSEGSWWIKASIFHTTAGKGITATWVIFLIYTGMIIGRAGREDAMLRGAFGEKWVRYAERAPYKLIPGVY
ncbi:hypothetical protein OF83DRAFT_1169984 [Amylostereum chailletii]|nr:hypothetical protein OF83DRAFT_1169984 [Amylostereum chailletii]